MNNIKVTDNDLLELDISKLTLTGIAVLKTLIEVEEAKHKSHFYFDFLNKHGENHNKNVSSHNEELVRILLQDKGDKK